MSVKIYTNRSSIEGGYRSCCNLIHQQHTLTFTLILFKIRQTPYGIWSWAGKANIRSWTITVGCIYAAHPHIKPKIFQDQFPPSISWQNTSKYSKISSRIFLYFYQFYLFRLSIFCISTHVALLIFYSTSRLHECTSVRANSLATQRAQVLTGSKVLAGKYMWVRHAHGDSSPQCLTPTEELIL